MIFSNLITKIHHINFRKRFRVDKYYLIYDKIKFNSVRFQMKRLFKKSFTKFATKYYDNEQHPNYQTI